LFMVDCKAGLTSADAHIARHLRTTGKPLLLLANKIDGHDYDVVVAPFYEMGFESIHPITATHGRGVKQLMEVVVATLAEIKASQIVDENALDDDQPAQGGIKIAVVGRPNVGKSTLVNRMLGEERVVVYDQPGTTRDSIYINYERHGKGYTLIDTAGIRRRKNVKETVEKFSIVKTLQAIDDANVVILMIDAQEGLVDQDLHLMGHVIDVGRALVVALNKWDGLEVEVKEFIKNELKRRLRFVDFADIHFISALHGTGVGHLYESVEQGYKSATDRFSSNHLTTVLQMATREHQPPMVRGHRIKLRFAHPGGHNPPIIVIHGNQTKEIPGHYVRYLEKTFRRALDLHGTPVRIQFKSSDNPYAGTKAPSTRQQARQRRLETNTPNRSPKKKTRR
jgi:GTP-binding protein